MRWLHIVVALLITTFHGASLAEAQWLTHPTLGIPRTADGKPDLSAPAPRLADGTPDLSGLWQVQIPPAYVVNVTADLDPTAVSATASRLSEQRMGDFGKDDPTMIGCLPSTARRSTRGGFAKVVQTPTLIVILYDDLSYRQIHMDGRTLPKEPNPTFMGYSVGRWDGDTLVVETIGFNDRTWLDFGGHPHTEQLRIVERLRRESFGRMQREVTLIDNELYTQPIKVPAVMTLAADTEMLEFVCAENPVSRPRLSGRSEEQKRVEVPPDVLATYVGTYDAVARVNFAVTVVTISLVNGQLFADLNGKGHLPMVPLSPTTFTPRLLGTYEFVKDASGKVTHLLAHETEGTHRFNRRP